tara:strand:- start:2367 stop:2768 length:402 start_codon:yes stop_codon:yes gene_type:complete
MLHFDITQARDKYWKHAEKKALAPAKRTFYLVVFTEVQQIRPCIGRNPKAPNWCTTVRLQRFEVSESEFGHRKDKFEGYEPIFKGISAYTMETGKIERITFYINTKEVKTIARAEYKSIKELRRDEEEQKRLQ